MTIGKTIALTRQTFVGKVMSLLFNRLSRFVRAFLPRRKRHLISRLGIQLIQKEWGLKHTWNAGHLYMGQQFLCSSLFLPEKQGRTSLTVSLPMIIIFYENVSNL